MVAFTLDTSGAVYMADACHPEPVRWGFEDLSTFAQEYVEALPWENLLAVAVQRGGWAWLNAKNRETDSADVRYFEASWRSLPGLGSYVKVPGFSDLAPETLAAIRKDCAAHEKAYPLLAHDPRRHNRGLNFWRNRQAGMWANSGWPPLTPYLSDDGKVCLREAG